MIEYFVSFWATAPAGGQFLSIRYKPQREIFTYDDVLSMTNAIRAYIEADSLVILNWKRLNTDHYKLEVVPPPSIVPVEKV